MGSISLDCREKSGFIQMTPPLCEGFCLFVDSVIEIDEGVLGKSLTEKEAKEPTTYGDQYSIDGVDLPKETG